jgi:hypothetical protein
VEYIYAVAENCVITSYGDESCWKPDIVVTWFSRLYGMMLVISKKPKLST